MDGSGGGATGGDASAGAGTGGEAGAAPTSYTLSAAATGAAPDGSETVDCTLTLFFQNAVYDGRGGFTAEMGGEVLRIVTAGDEKYEFQALVGFAATLVPTAEGVDVILNDMPDPTAKPFWQELDVLHGEPNDTYEWAGAWRCAPLMIDEPNWHDTKTTVDGTWTLLPSE